MFAALWQPGGIAPAGRRLANRRHGPGRQQVGGNQSTLRQLALDNEVYPKDYDGNRHNMLRPLGAILNGRGDELQSSADVTDVK